MAGGPLHVRDLWRPAGTTAALAVLSACDTVRGGAALPDEALTLGTAFQLAGFRHVIGALWAISDTLTVQLCEDLYAALAVPGGLDPERAASALHHAVRQVRAALPDLPELWAGYAHLPISPGRPGAGRRRTARDRAPARVRAGRARTR